METTLAGAFIVFLEALPAPMSWFMESRHADWLAGNPHGSSSAVLHRMKLSPSRWPVESALDILDLAGLTVPDSILSTIVVIQDSGRFPKHASFPVNPHWTAWSHGRGTKRLEEDQQAFDPMDRQPTKAQAMVRVRGQEQQR